MKKTTLIFIFLLFIPPATALTNNLTLLAVKETNNNTYEGSTAQLYLETNSGQSRVFIDTYPLTKLDTQISTRFAKEIACNYFNLNCQNYDFFYTIRSQSTIIGGPSAGAAVAALTTINLKNLPFHEKTTITGTINSGGIIGPVGGLKEKIEIAVQENLRTVLIPQGTRFHKNENNFSLDLIDYGKKLGIQVIEVSDLNEVLYYFTNQTLIETNLTFTKNKNYTSIMKKINQEICERTEELKQKSSLNQSQADYVNNKTLQSQQAFLQDDYYSSASYCFGLNYYLQNTLLQNITYNQSLLKKEELQQQINQFKQTLQNITLNKIPALQTYTIVIERLSEAEQYLEKINQDNHQGNLAYALERHFTALKWSLFFDMPGQELNINQQNLADSCLKKIQEARERFHYVNLFIPFDLERLDQEINKANEAYQNKDYALCLIKASQAKANTNAILSSLGVEEDKLNILIDNKKRAVEKALAKVTSQGFFPILGYSYYEYALSLRNESPQSSIIYLEYALEMSNFDIYFREETPHKTASPGDKQETPRDLIIFGLGFLTAILFLYSYSLVKKINKE